MRPTAPALGSPTSRSRPRAAERPSRSPSAQYRWPGSRGASPATPPSPPRAATCARGASPASGCGSPTASSSTTSTPAAASHRRWRWPTSRRAASCTASPSPASNAASRLKPTTSRRPPEPRSRSKPTPPPEPAPRLGSADLPHETGALARALIGKLLVRRWAGELLVGRIVETEAYYPDDPASHAFGGMTRRNRAMFGPPLHAYVYFVYGANWCLNVTSEREGTGAAALVRACEPLSGMATMRALRGRPGVSDRD